tara:strand:- start:1678 stop:2352 length:675 start_codon:yes stop_codon:yes gene_type:complete
MPDYLVTLNQPGQYSVGVDYEIPSKSIQYGNIVLDTLTGFNGIGVTFSLTDQGQSYVPNNNQQLIVSKNNLLLQPTADYTISGDKIIFTQPPASSDNVFMIALATAADLTRSVNYVIDSGSTPMLAGSKGKITLDVSGVIESIKVLSDQTGNVAFEISKSNFNDYPTFTTITGGNRVILSNSNKYFDDVLNNWDTSIVAGDILDFEVISVTGIRRFLISLKLKL